MSNMIKYEREKIRGRKIKQNKTHWSNKRKKLYNLFNFLHIIGQGVLTLLKRNEGRISFRTHNDTCFHC